MLSFDANTGMEEFIVLDKENAYDYEIKCHTI